MYELTMDRCNLTQAFLSINNLLRWSSTDDAVYLYKTRIFHVTQPIDAYTAGSFLDEAKIPNGKVRVSLNANGSLKAAHSASVASNG